MTRRRTRVVLLSCAAAAMLGSHAAAEAFTPVPVPLSTYATESRPTPIDAFRGHTVWSRFDQARERFRLVHRFRGRTEILPIRSSGAVFDADLGPDGRNRVALVYSRCAGFEEPRFGGGGFTGCDLFRYDFATRHETKLRALSTAAASEHLPSLWRGRIAFVRSRSGLAALLIGRVASATSVRQVPVRAPAGVPIPEDLELHGDHLAFVWTTRLETPHTAAFASIPLHTGVWLHDLSKGKARPLSSERYTTFPAFNYLSPSFAGGYVYLGVRTGRSRVFRWPVAGGRPRQAVVPDPLISVQRDRGAFIYVLGADREPEYRWPCSVGHTDVFIGSPSPPRFCSVGASRQIRFTRVRPAA